MVISFRFATVMEKGKCIQCLLKTENALLSVVKNLQNIFFSLANYRKVVKNNVKMI